jgi:hypothetical protein
MVNQIKNRPMCLPTQWTGGEVLAFVCRSTK